MGNWSRKDQGSSDRNRACYPTKADPDRAARMESGSPANRRDGRSYPERCDPFGVRTPLTDEQRGLATRYMPLARSLANGYRYERVVERDELRSTAYLALVEAARTFDPKRNVNFATYARHRIRGALRDFQRFLLSATWHGTEACRPVLQSLAKGVEAHGQVLGVEPARPIGTEIETTELVEEWLSRLPRVHAVACRLIYIHGQSQDEVAASLGCSKSFLSRLHREAISMLIMEYQAAHAGQQRDPSETPG